MKKLLLLLFIFAATFIPTTAQTPAPTPPPIRKKTAAPAEEIPDKEWIFKTNTRLIRNRRYYSEDKRYAVIFQRDGNLVIYKFSAPEKFAPIWNTHSAGSFAGFCRFQADGNLVLYNGDSPVWDSKSDAKNRKKKWYNILPTSPMDEPSLSFNTWMQMQNDGNLVIYTGSYPNGSPLWSSDTFEKN